MKKIHNYYVVGATVAMALSFVPVLAHAENIVETGVSAGVSADIDGGQRGPGGSGQVTQMIRQRIMNAENMREGHGPMGSSTQSRDFRNQVIRGKAQMNPRFASTTASTTLNFRHGPEREDDEDNSTSTDDHRGRMMPPGLMMRMNATTTHGMKEAHGELFDKMKQNLVKQADQALKNLKEIRARVSSRIDSAQASGRNMSEAKAKLVIADAKITLAEQAVANLDALAVSATSTGTTTVSLEKPREIGKSTIEAINAARKALQEVVVAIAHGMGFKIGLDGHIETGTTTPTTSTTTTTTATSTATTTTQ